MVRQQLKRLAGIDREVEVEALPGERCRDGHAQAWAGVPGWNSRCARTAWRGCAPTGRTRSSRSRSASIAHRAITGLAITGRRWPGAASVEALVAPASGERAVIVSAARDAGTTVRSESIEQVAAESVLRSTGRRHQRLTPVRGRGYLSQHAVGRDWRVSAGAFWQVHPAAADVLTDAVLAGLQPRPGDVALDLYCGVGLFAGALAPAVGPGGTVIGVEAARRRSATPGTTCANGRGPGCTEVTWRRCCDRGGLPPARLAVADPPRSGLAREVIEYLSSAGNGAGRFAYVSCDPATLARDIGLLAARGWTLDGLRAFDAFPMTHHVECVAILSAGGEVTEADGPRSRR